MNSIALRRLAASVLFGFGVALAATRAVATGAEDDLPAPKLIEPEGVEAALSECEAKAAEVPENQDPDAVRSECVHDITGDLLEARVLNAPSLMQTFRTTSKEFCWLRVMGSHIRAKRDGHLTCIEHPEEEYEPTAEDYAWVSHCALEQEKSLLAITLKHGAFHGSLADRILPAAADATPLSRNRVYTEVGAIDDCQPVAKKRLVAWDIGIGNLCKELTGSSDEYAPPSVKCNAELWERAASTWNAAAAVPR